MLLIWNMKSKSWNSNVPSKLIIIICTIMYDDRGDIYKSLLKRTFTTRTMNWGTGKNFNLAGQFIICLNIFRRVPFRHPPVEISPQKSIDFSLLNISGIFLRNSFSIVLAHCAASYNFLLWMINYTKNALSGSLYTRL